MGELERAICETPPPKPELDADLDRILLQALTERMPDIRLDGEASRLRSNFINGIKHMPVRFIPSPATGIYRLSAIRAV